MLIRNRIKYELESLLKDMNFARRVYGSEISASANAYVKGYRKALEKVLSMTMKNGKR